jgi:hypothetical protein
MKHDLIVFTSKIKIKCFDCFVLFCFVLDLVYSKVKLRQEQHHDDQEDEGRDLGLKAFLSPTSPRNNSLNLQPLLLFRNFILIQIILS